MNYTRRNFMIRTGAASALCGLQGFGNSFPSAMAAAPEMPDFPQPCSPKSWTKHGIVIEPDEPWEGNHIEAFISTIEPLENDNWRIWYAANSPIEGYIGIAYAEGVPGQKMVKTRAVLSEGEPEDAPFAIGNVPKNWRLAAPTYFRLRDGRHRLYFFVTGRDGRHAVQRYLAADSEDGRRFRVLDPERPSLYTFWDTTTDKKFLPGQKLDSILTNDGATVYQLPDGSFEMFAQSCETVDKNDPRYFAHDNIPGGLRFIDRFTSEDGIRFDNRQRKVLAPDKDDPLDTQFYMLTVTHTPQGRVGLLNWYRVDAGYMELQYAFSKDGITWDRVRKPWIERGNSGEPDSVTIYQPSQMVHRDDKWWLFYSGVNYTHSTVETAKPGETQRSVILLATTPSLFSA